MLWLLFAMNECYEFVWGFSFSMVLQTALQISEVFRLWTNNEDNSFIVLYLVFVIFNSDVKQYYISTDMADMSHLKGSLWSHELWLMSDCKVTWEDHDDLEKNISTSNCPSHWITSNMIDSGWIEQPFQVSFWTVMFLIYLLSHMSGIFLSICPQEARVHSALVRSLQITVSKVMLVLLLF